MYYFRIGLEPIHPPLNDGQMSFASVIPQLRSNLLDIIGEDALVDISPDWASYSWEKKFFVFVSDKTALTKIILAFPDAEWWENT